MKNQYFVRSVLVSLLCVPLFVGASTSDDIRSQIQVLQAQIVELQKQLEALNTGPDASTTVDDSCPLISKTLSYGSRDADVVLLQRFLIARGLLSTDSATGFFGPATESAVKKWQSTNAIVSSGSPDSTGYGVVGIRTRTSITDHCKKVAVEIPKETPEDIAFAEPFVKAGCVREKDKVYNCEKTEVASKCDSLGEAGYLYSSRISGNEFGIPMVACHVQVEKYYGNPDIHSEFFSCSGGLAPSCTAYIGYVDGTFKTIKNPKELQKIIGSITTPEQAELLVLLATDVATKQIYPSVWSNGVSTKPIPGTPGLVAPYKTDNGFVVTLYEPEHVFGCFSSNAYYRVEFLVSTDGEITRTNKKEVYKEEGFSVCVD
jgi:peptidoglycan hydrolase-like protein with peptidoglycan-binding domain